MPEEAKLKIIGSRTYWITAPNYIPKPSAGVPPGLCDTIRNTAGCFVYVWLKNNREFWFYPEEISGGTLTGYGWNGSKWSGVSFRSDSVLSYC
ncbi:MAG: hypothetical protein LBR72_08010 [Oscillospiraceae bacterium]|jgi:hypothetical protein|nr:hypothetical protein [Oscillospiraceae bacterium]